MRQLVFGLVCLPLHASPRDGSGASQFVAAPAGTAGQPNQPDARLPPGGVTMGTRMRKTLFALLCVLLSGLPAAADPLNDALALYDEGQYHEAIPLLTPLAEDGVLDAQVALFNIYNFGFGVPIDQPTAIAWIAMAAEQDDPDAIYNLAAMTLEGQGTAQDPGKAIQLLYRAAELKSPEALYLLGVIAIQQAPLTGEIDTGLAYLTDAARRIGHAGRAAAGNSRDRAPPRQVRVPFSDGRKAGL